MLNHSVLDCRCGVHTNFHIINVIWHIYSREGWACILMPCWLLMIMGTHSPYSCNRFISSNVRSLQKTREIKLRTNGNENGSGAKIIWARISTLCSVPMKILVNPRLKRTGALFPFDESILKMVEIVSASRIKWLFYSIAEKHLLLSGSKLLNTTAVKIATERQ